jgi:hypothetical protein
VTGRYYFTVMVAFMLGWIAQWYVNVPAVVNVCVKVAPVPSGSLLNELSSAVTVWLVESWFIHVTVVPTATSSVAGEKEKFWIVTAPAAAPPPPDDACGAVLAAGGVAVAAAGAAVELLEHAARASAATAMSVAILVARMTILQRQ